MIPGLPRVMKCPGCTHPLLFRTTVSRNNLGSIHWSDGKTESPMMPDEPLLQISPSESALFWTEDCEEIGRLDSVGARDHPHWGRLDYAREPSEAEYASALESGFAKGDANREFYIRQRLWWTGNIVRRGWNDVPRPDGPPPPPLSVIALHRHNLEAMLSILGPDRSPDAVLYRAEILRQLSRFDESMALLETVESSPQRDYVADLVFHFAGNRIPHVFRILERGPSDPAPPKSRRKRPAPPSPDEARLPGVATQRLRVYDDEKRAAAAREVAAIVGLGTFDQTFLENFLGQKFPPGSTPRLLDAGCGAGRVALGLWEMGYRDIDACDFAPAQVAEARAYLSEKQTGVRVENWDFSRLPVPDGHYDVVVCLGNTLSEFSSVEEQVAAIKEFARVVKIGGSLLYSTARNRDEDELQHMMRSPNLTPGHGWNGGSSSCDFRFRAPPDEAELKVFGFRCYHTNERIAETKPLG